ncbi:Ig-like domain-containing protein [Nocardioides sp. KR10-350]|uniref:Ig-like domain-containing protein n=1 Tax=Nocardioides cheoyonin TaxID=3156615 RepID=UPI0032B4771D
MNTRNRAFRRTLPPIAAAALAAGSFALLPGAASAASGDLTYSCTYGDLVSGAQPTTVSIDTDAPDSTPASAPLDITTTATVTLPDAVKTALSNLGYQGVELIGQDDADASRLGVKQIYVASGTQIPVTTHPSFKHTTGSEFSGSSPAPNHLDHGPTIPGTAQVKAGDMVLELDVYTTSSTPTVYPVNCTAPSGSPVIDTMKVTAPTSTTVSLSKSSWTAGDPPATATATVTRTGSTSSWPDATGSVQFAVGGKTVSDTVDSNGKASATLPALPGHASYTVTATYEPDSASPYLTSTVTSSSVDVVAPTTTKVGVSDPNPEIGDSSTATATVGSDAGTPGGSVQFMVDGAPFGAPVAVNSGTASIPLDTSAKGAHKVTADFTPSDDLYAGSTSDEESFSVGVPTTTTALGLSRSSAAYGQKPSFTATVAASRGTAAGKVQFKYGTRTATVAVVNGKARFTAPVLAVGSYRVTATYVPTSADSFTGSASASRTLRIVKDTTTTRQSLLNAKYKKKLASTVTVKTKYGTLAVGKVTLVLKHAGKKVGSKTVTLRKGVAKATFNKLTKTGGWSVVASYAGGTNLNKSSNTRSFTVRR